MKKSFLLLIIIAMLVVAFIGCGRSVTGEIRDALTSELITNEVVLYFDGEPMTVKGGEFALRKIEEGPHTFRVEHTGYIKYEKTLTLKAKSKVVIALISNTAPISQTSWTPNDNHQVVGL